MLFLADCVWNRVEQVTDGRATGFNKNRKLALIAFFLFCINSASLEVWPPT